MGKSNRYTEKLKPSQQSIEATYLDFEELKSLIDNKKAKKAGYRILNDGKWFDPNYPNFSNFRIKHDRLDIYLEKIETHLSLKNKCLRKNKVRIDSNWKIHKNKPRNTYGSEYVSNYKDVFNRGHLIADSLMTYSDKFDLYKWQDFVMLTDWCNRANSSGEACGMYYFEEIIINTLKNNVEVDYRVTPVFKKIGSTEETNKYEVLPRGVILEAKIKEGEEFVFPQGKDNPFSNSHQINVFIPNAQGDLIINYETGEVCKNKL